MRQSFILAHAEARRRAVAAVQQAPDGHAVTVAEPSRSVEQNAAQWPILEAFSQQLKWPVDGELVRMTSEEWKDVLSAAFKTEHVRLARGLNGGVVMIGRGMATSGMGKREFSDWLEFLHATAAMRGVMLSRATGSDNAGPSRPVPYSRTTSQEAPFSTTTRSS
jgi:hypothetical protein